ncbi:M24 family metallopeptidase, partial [Halovivax sp.]|uniref:M24 family metallopeptidase n=1 Tax=Halovivax sp. TaxID=1935978 RepID=UPI0025C15275
MTAPAIEPIRAALADRGADAFVHAGSPSDPGLDYLRARGSPTVDAGSTIAAAVTPDAEFALAADADRHPAERLAVALCDRGLSGTLLAPPSIPHDAALYLEGAGFELASSDALDRARAIKTAAAVERIERAQAAASAGLDRAASVLAGATVEDGRLHRDGAPLTAERLRRLADVAVVESGAVPAGSTRVETVGSPAEPRPPANGDGATGPDEPLRSGEPLVLELAPREPSGYRAGLVRTLVPGTDGGWERRAHVAVESALRSARTMLAADGATVDAVETELEAEVRSFGFGRGASGSVHGVGLEARER